MEKEIRKPRESEYDERIIDINRVSKKTKGGNRLAFSVLMVVGDRKGKVGVGLGKAAEVPDAIQKASVKAKKKMIRVPMKGNTIAREIRYKKGSALIFLKPAVSGTGVIAGGPVKAVLEAAGVRDVLSKVLGSNNHTGNVYATIAAMQQISRFERIKQSRIEKNKNKE